MGDESQEAKLAVAVNDIAWMKQSMTDTNEGVKSLQRTLDEHIRTQGDKWASKQELHAIRKDVESLKAWRWKVAGGLALAGIVVCYFAESLRGLKG